MTLEDLTQHSNQELCKYNFIHHAAMMEVFNCKDKLIINSAVIHAQTIIKSDIQLAQDEIDKARIEIINKMKKHKVKFFFYKLLFTLRYLKTIIKAKLLLYINGKKKTRVL